VERTLVLLKPDAVERGLVGRILTRFEEKGLKIIGMNMRIFPEDHIRQHYAVHKGRPFFEGLVRFMSTGPVVAIALEGRNAITVVRTMLGKTDGAESPPGTIRGDFGLSRSHNLTHGSDSAENAATELKHWFGSKGALFDWTPASEAWVYDVEEELR